MSQASRASFDPVFISLRGIEGAQLFVGVLGVITVTGEYTSGLIRGTFIATPQRAQVIAMKALIFAAVVWAWCTLLSFAAFFIGQPLLCLRRDLLPDRGQRHRPVHRRHRSQRGGGDSAVFGVFLVLPTLLNSLDSGVWRHLVPYLPSNLGNALWLSHSGWLAKPIIAALGLAAYAIVLGVLATYSLRRHSISLITIQAEAATRAARTSPDAVPGFLTSISAASRQALAEMRHVLAILRPDAGAELSPQPGPGGPR